MVLGIALLYVWPLGIALLYVWPGQQIWGTLPTIDSLKAAQPYFERAVPCEYQSYHSRPCCTRTLHTTHHIPCAT